jgi:paraquat-inducible protein B
MSTQETAATPVPDELPEAVVARQGRVSIVWLIPVVALVIGGWLAYTAWSEQGPTIGIAFKSAAGLQAGKTKVKFKDVDVGTVTAIEVAEDLAGVVVTAQLVDGAEAYLREGTRFWVERPRVTASRVTGLETLLSGAYIAVDPATQGRAERDFVGLEEPPLFTTSEPGRKFVLRSAALGSLNIGSPVYYRDIQVGQVVGYQLEPDGRGVSIDIFIAAPHDDLVLTTSRFWNVSGVEVRLSAEGVAVDTQSLLALMIGGIGFDTPELLDPGALAEEDTHFPLYASREQAHERTFLYKERYLLYFSGSVRGLEVGAPVLLRGIRIGQVLDVELKLDLQDFGFRIPVLVEVEPERVGLIGDPGPLKVEEMVERLVQQGLRGQLKSGNLLTGALYVDLDFHPEAPPAAITREGDYRVVPTVAAPLDAIATKANQFLDTLLGLPLEAIGTDLRETLRSTRAVVESPELMASLKALEGALTQVDETAQSYQGLTPRVEAALRQAQMTLAAAEALVGADSAISGELRRLLRELSAAARSIRAMADYLERHPEALLKGKGGTR